ncbi:methionyl-tRNA synthetase [Natronospira proteinivora]|uniref:Methionine--tRNA ligase n=1 Tax=Natronospira proteinivora TaxID=1807133 RepID=A0ABT1G858_9GAMM|nr:methionine--tRNA ligase [Natronospira proteinivora]MCP1726157.1 methionyl-tRNA synthetase [Natronospira proteinivora]
MSEKRRRILVTSALPYANGHLHLGHMLEYIQTDIWVRFQKMRGHECHYVCAEDAHGTPIMLKARQEGISPEELIRKLADSHKRDFDEFRIGFDNYHSTHSEENRVLAETIYVRLREAGHIDSRTIRQAYDEQEGMFLPDRFIRGECPKCGAEDQYGDSCEVCGATYSPAELKNPVSVVSGSTPVERESEHYFFRLADFEAMLREWTGADGKAQNNLQEAVSAKLQEWFDAGLQDWDISRDAPYFGFEIPDAPGKFFYVWLDAPMGYMASFRQLCERSGLNFDDFWAAGQEDQTEVYHFIGKDIIYFHALFWPAILHGAGFRRPTAVWAHGFLTVDGQKMSKSRGTFIQARTWLDHLDGEYLRYYFAAKLSDRVEDIDLSLSDFTNRVNSDLVGKLVNIASRTAGFVRKKFDNRLGSEMEPEGEALYQDIVAASDEIAADFERRAFSQAMRKIMALADRVNQYVSEKAPWTLAKEEARLAEVQAICTAALNSFRVLVGYLRPVVPALAERAEHFLNIDAPQWDQLAEPLVNHRIRKFKPLLTRVEPEQIDKLLEASKENLEAQTAADAGKKNSQQEKTAVDELAPECTIDDFMKVDLRVAKIAQAEHVEGADKLLRLQLDIGGETRQVFAGIKSAYAPEQLEGKLTVMVANLKPRKMRFGVSEGMVLAAGDGESLHILEPDSGATPGMRVK